MISPTWAIADVETRVNPLIASRMRRSGVPSAGSPSIPKIPAMITSSVTACIRSAMVTVAPSLQLPTSRSAASRIISE